MSRGERAYALVVAATALVVAVLFIRDYPIASWAPVIGLIALNFITENYAFELPMSGSVSLSFAVTFAAMLYSGPLAAIVCAASGAVTLQEIRDGKPAHVLAFNAGQLVLSASAASLLYLGLGGRPLLGAEGTTIALLPALAAAASFFVVNVLLVGRFISIRRDERFSTVLRTQGFLSYGASHIVLALLGVMIAQLLSLASWLGLVLLVLPFMSARRTFRVYAELTEAYTSTVRSLVAAIEAKDPYTRGHSERVAAYSRMLADHLGLSRPESELVERAALLHDVGKIGIDLRTLTSPTALASEEVQAIREHPVLGSNLVSEVEFLSDTVPVIRHHHERFDGAGYPDGLVGEEIPALARILAVADSYDAMTSDRAYRPRMTQAAAVAEIRRVAGTQLDKVFAERFTDLLTDESASA